MAQGIALGEGGAVTDDMKQARRITKYHGRASTELLNREMDVGYARCAQLVQELKRTGFVGPDRLVTVPAGSTP